MNAHCNTKWRCGRCELKLEKYFGRYRRRRLRRLARLAINQGRKDGFSDFNRRWAHNRCYVCVFNATKHRQYQRQAA